MSMINQKKDIEQYKQTKPVQLQLFELDDPEYSNSIELYDAMPKYYIGGAEREKGKSVDSLPILNREFMHRGRPYKIDIMPAAILNKKTGRTVYYYPSQREELVEDALRKIATRGGAMQFDDKIGVKFTYYQLQQELQKMGHGYSIAEVKLAIDIMGKAGIELTSKDDQVSVTSNFFTWVGKETHEKNGRERVVAMFHNLVTRSINQGTYRTFNYDRLMKMRMPLSRWLYKRISHLFSQATVNNPYQIKLSTIIRDSGMKSYKTISERTRQVEKALTELKTNKVITRFEKDVVKEKNKILEVLYSLFMGEKFVADAKKANALANLRLIDANGEKGEAFDIEILRKEMEEPIYGLTKTIINNTISKIFTKEEYDLTISSLEAAKEYIKEKGTTKAIAITKAALRDGWEPKKDNAETEKLPESDLKTMEGLKKYKEDKNKADELRKELQNSPTWLKIKKQIKKEFGDSNWDKWFKLLEIHSLKGSKIVLIAPDKFIRDWIIRDFIENKASKKTLQDVIKVISPEITNVSVICDM